jgi:hypothetical protein
MHGLIIKKNAVANETDDNKNGEVFCRVSIASKEQRISIVESMIDDPNNDERANHV